MIFHLQYHSQRSTENKERQSARHMCDAKMANSTLVSYSSYNAREATNRTKSITCTKSPHNCPAIQHKYTPFQETPPDFLPFIREKLRNQNLSRAAQDIIISSWRKGSTKQYRTYLLRWQEFCRCKGLSLYSPGTGNAIEFLTEMYKSGLGYCAINTARSALSSKILPTSVLRLPQLHMLKQLD